MSQSAGRRKKDNSFSKGEKSSTRGSKSQKRDSAPSSPSASFSGKESTDVPTNNGGTIQLEDRTRWILTNLLGKLVEVQLKNEEVYEGVLHDITTEGGLGAILQMVRKKEADPDKKVVYLTRPIERFEVKSADLVQIFAKDISFEVVKPREFATDKEISGTFGTGERELQRWMPAEDDPPPSPFLSLDNKGKPWNQFEANKRFGVESTYDEDIYTIRLDKNSQFYKENEAAAARLAQEIEGKMSSSAHLNEERGLTIDDSGLDEEDRYSSVFRDPASQGSSDKPGKYVPPAKRTTYASKVRGDDKQEQEPAPKNSKAKEQPKDSKAVKETPKETKEQKEHKEAATKETKPKETKDVKDVSTEASKSQEILKSAPKDIVGKPVSEKDMPHPIRPFKNNLSSSLDRSSSWDRGSPKTPRSPTFIAERLKLRHALASSEKLKNTAPITEELGTRSPLQSPFVGDPRTINALSLDPTIPQVSAEVVRDFLDFSLTQKKESRKNLIAEMKSFSLNLKIPAKTAEAAPVKPSAAAAVKSPPPKQPATTQPSKTTPSNPPTKSTETAKPAEPPKPVETPAKPSEPASKPAEANSKPAEVSTTPESAQSGANAKPPAAASTPAAKTDFKSKLNPNAKTFKPMSANAPAFVPGQSAAAMAQAVSDPGDQFAYRPGYPGRVEDAVGVEPFYPTGYPPRFYPYPMAYPAGPVRVVPTPAYYAPAFYPVAAPIAPVTAGAQQPGNNKRTAAPGAKGSAPAQVGVPTQFTGPVPHPGFYAQYPQAMGFQRNANMFPTDGRNVNPNAHEEGSVKDETGPHSNQRKPQFQVPNTDSIPPSTDAKPQ